MKTAKLLTILFVGFVISLLLSCDELFKSEPLVDYPSDVLPEATQIGADRLGCLLNGEVFANSKHVKVAFNEQRISAYYASMPVNTFFIGAYSHDKTWISLSVHVDSLIVNDTVNIRQVRYSTTFSEDYVYPRYIDNKNGKLYLTCFDTVNHIISGNFSFTAHSVDIYGKPYGDSIIHGTHGRFDIKYTPKSE